MSPLGCRCCRRCGSDSPSLPLSLFTYLEQCAGQNDPSLWTKSRASVGGCLGASSLYIGLNNCSFNSGTTFETPFQVTAHGRMHLHNSEVAAVAGLCFQFQGVRNPPPCAAWHQHTSEVAAVAGSAVKDSKPSMPSLGSSSSSDGGQGEEDSSSDEPALAAEEAPSPKGEQTASRKAQIGSTRSRAAGWTPRVACTQRLQVGPCCLCEICPGHGDGSGRTKQTGVWACWAGPTSKAHARTLEQAQLLLGLA